MEVTLNIELEKRWSDCMLFIRNSGLVGVEQFNAWFSPIKPVSLNGNRLDVSVPSDFFCSHLEHNYKHILIPGIRKFFGNNIELYYNYLVVSNDDSSTVRLKTENQSVNVGKKIAEGARRSPFDADNRPVDEELDSQLNPRYNFSNFCVSACNRLASTIGNAIVSDPSCRTFNPLFIHGASGVGKTHLMHAIGIGIKEKNPKARVLYVTSRLFESQSVYALRNGKMNDFLEFYQSIDYLLVDDIQELIGKEKTQNSFFHIFNHLQLNNKQIIITSDCKPSDMEGMPERLLSRFKWGMTVELELPDFELRSQILLQKSLTEGVELAPEIIEHIARNVKCSIRELEGIMVNLMARVTFMGEVISVDMIDRILADIVKPRHHEVTFETITQSVSSYYKIDPDELFTKSRKREVADARQMIMYLAKKHTSMKFKTIGTRMARNHSTVMHACRCIDERLEIEKQLRKDIEAIEEKI